MTETAQKTEPTQGGRTARLRRMQFRLGALVAILVIAGIVIWLAVGRNSSSPSTTNAVAISPTGLTSLASSLNQPIYWVGPMDGVTYEMIREKDGRLLLGYDPPGMKVGENKAHLTVGTYPITNAYAVTQRAASQPGTVKIDVGGGAVAFYNKSYPLSSFVSYPGSNYQVEVYDPKSGESRRLVAAGKVKPVPGSPAQTTGAVAVSAKQLAKRAGDEHQPIYWAGPMPKTTYELSETSKRWFLVRYLPRGVPVGSGGTYLTVGTYPVADAYGAVQRLAREKGAHQYTLGDGALAVSNPHHFPYSVFLAYPGSNYQVEVFDPSHARALRLVRAGKIAAAS